LVDVTESENVLIKSEGRMRARVETFQSKHRFQKVEEMTCRRI
jgi:hypothetical protein